MNDMSNIIITTYFIYHETYDRINHLKNLIIPRLIEMQQMKIHIFANIRECMSISILLFVYRALLKNKIYCPFNKRIQGKKFLHRISSEHVKKNAKTIYKERKSFNWKQF